MAHFSVVSFTQMGLLLVLICWTTCSTGAAFSSEEEFRQLKQNYIQMKEVVKILEAKVSQLKSLESKVIHLETKDAEMQEKVTELEDKIQLQDSLLSSLLREKNDRTAANGSDSALIGDDQSAVSINGLPSSCSDLKMIGHIWSGFYSVMGSSMMESVYCDFTKLPGDAGFQKLIGYADVKSAPVHFYVQRNSSFNSAGIPITFDLARVNEGNAMDLTSGIFTAPRPGIYFFSFTGEMYLPIMSYPAQPTFGVLLELNGGNIGTSHAAVYHNSSTTGYLSSPLTLQLTLNLKIGDQVWLILYDITKDQYLYDSNTHHTHFTGFMLEEEIAASL